jgi:hypothetical protein
MALFHGPVCLGISVPANSEIARSPRRGSIVSATHQCGASPGRGRTPFALVEHTALRLQRADAACRERLEREAAD